MESLLLVFGLELLGKGTKKVDEGDAWRRIRGA